MKPVGPIKSLPKKERYGFYIFSVAVVFFLAFSLYNFSVRIKNPLAPKNTNPTQFLNESEEQRQKLIELQGKDTDRDGLSDYDEIYVYYTSPYLEDTDSDGMTDRDEIMAGEDPVCPKGQSCSPYADVADKSASGPEVFANGEIAKAQEGMATTAEQMRQMLISSGQFTADDLANISDDDLLQLSGLSSQTSDLTNLNFELPQVPGVEQLNENNTSGSDIPLNFNGNTALSANTNANAAPSTAELRAYLIKNGFDEAALNKISDEDLLKMFAETAQENPDSIK